MTSIPFDRGRLCRFDELEDPGSKAFCLNARGETTEILVVRHNYRVYAYRNSCPHTGATLDWVPGEFLDRQREFIQCATHGALFRLVDGLCVYGPCAGDYLAPVPVTVTNGDVIWTGRDIEPRGAQE
jgi:nitrite reductase/ring-hydroxylating ferredoxin subunit